MAFPLHFPRKRLARVLHDLALSSVARAESLDPLLLSEGRAPLASLRRAPRRIRLPHRRSQPLAGCSETREQRLHVLLLVVAQVSVGLLLELRRQLRARLRFLTTRNRRVEDPAPRGIRIDFRANMLNRRLVSRRRSRIREHIEEETL